MLRKQSKFRFIKSKPSKESYRQLQAAEPRSNSAGIAATANLIAIQNSLGGKIQLLPTSPALYTPTSNPKLVVAHPDTLGDFNFSPFNASESECEFLATSGLNDNFFKLWKIPYTGIEANLETPSLSLDCKTSINSLSFHPSTDSAVAIGGKKISAGLIDLNKSEVVQSFTLDQNPEALQVNYNFDGSVISLINKNGNYCFYDPRTPNPTDLSNINSNSSFKATSILWLDDSNHFIVAGTERRTPKIAYFDFKNSYAPLDSNFSLPFSTGTLFPYFDVSSQLLLFACRGSSMVHLYDFSDRKLYPVDSVVSKQQTSGIAILPKYANDILAREVIRMYKLTAGVNGVVESTGFFVPRVMGGFHEDLFPPTWSNKPTLSGEEYFEGKNSTPLLQSPDPSLKYFKKTKIVLPETNAEKETRLKEEEVKRIEELKIQERNEFLNKSEQRSKLDEQFKSTRSPLTNTRIFEPKDDAFHYSHVQADFCIPLNQNLEMNDKFLAFPWTAQGGSAVAVVPLSSHGRLPVAPPLIHGHSNQVTSIALSQCKSNLFASGSSDCHVKMWNIPDKLEKKGLQNKDVIMDLSDFNGRVLYVGFHPHVENLMTTTSQGYDGMQLKLWDINTSSSIWGNREHKDSVFEVQWEPYSNQLFATSSLDKSARIFDPRTQNCVMEWSPEEGAHDLRVVWGSPSRIMTMGADRYGKRHISIFDTHNCQSPLKTVSLDTSRATFMPYYDDDLHLLILGNGGDRTFNVYDVKNDSFEFITMLRSSGLIFGLSYFHKTKCSIKDVSVAQCLCLQQNAIIPLQFQIPRKRKEYFQDDLFVPTLPFGACISKEDLFSEKNISLERVSLRPDGMPLLSEAPPEELTEAQKKHLDYSREAKKPKPKGAMGLTEEEVFSQMTATSKVVGGKTNKWDAKFVDTNDVADDEWGD